MNKKHLTHEIVKILNDTPYFLNPEEVGKNNINWIFDDIDKQHYSYIYSKFLRYVLLEVLDVSLIRGKQIGSIYSILSAVGNLKNDRSLISFLQDSGLLIDEHANTGEDYFLHNFHIGLWDFIEQYLLTKQMIQYIDERPLPGDPKHNESCTLVLTKIGKLFVFAFGEMESEWSEITWDQIVKTKLSH